MSAPGRAPLEWAAREQKEARKGVRRRVLAWVGLNPAAQRADALAARAAHGAVGEQWTATLLEQLPAGWVVFYGRKLPGYANDRQEEVEKAARAAGRLERALAVPGVQVWPLLVVHGSRIVQPYPLPQGRLEARAKGWAGPVHVLGPQWLVPTLSAAPRGRDPRRAAALAGRVERVLPPCRG